MLLSPRLTTRGDPSSSLQNINTSQLADGAECYVEANKTLYRLDRTSTSTDSGDAVVAPISGPGRWKPAQSSGAGSVLQVQTTELQNGEIVTSTSFVALANTVLPPISMDVTPGSKVVLDGVASLISAAAAGGQGVLARLTKKEPSDPSPVEIGIISRAIVLPSAEGEQQLVTRADFIASEGGTVVLNMEFLTSNGASGLNFATSVGPVYIEATEVAQ